MVVKNAVCWASRLAGLLAVQWDDLKAGWKAALSGCWKAEPWVDGSVDLMVLVSVAE